MIFSTFSGAIWLAVPVASFPQVIKSTLVSNETVLGDQTTVHYEVKVNMLQPVGTYLTTVTYTAIAN